MKPTKLLAGNRPQDASPSRLKFTPAPRNWSFTEEERRAYLNANNPDYQRFQALCAQLTFKE